MFVRFGESQFPSLVINLEGLLALELGKKDDGKSTIEITKTGGKFVLPFSNETVARRCYAFLVMKWYNTTKKFGKETIDDCIINVCAATRQPHILKDLQIFEDETELFVNGVIGPNGVNLKMLPKEDSVDETEQEKE